MGSKKRGKEFFELCVIILSLFTSAYEGASVSSIEPRYGSLAGETRLSIHGSGFSADQYSQDDDPDTGNYVYLVGASGSKYSCPVLKDGSTETLIVCYTPLGMTEEDHYVKVTVDGTPVADSNMCNNRPTSSSCAHKPASSYTPTITTFSPQYGMPGEMVNMAGKLFSDRYGSNLASATNGRLEKLLRVYVGPQDCGLKDIDDFFGLYLNDEDSDDGVLRCETKGTSVGFFNASYIIEAPFGRSLVDGYLYRVSYNDQIYLYQTYTDITSISHATGSVNGGLTLRINGDHFDGRAPYEPVKAFVGETVCDVTYVEPGQYVECIVAAEPVTSTSPHVGNRGVVFETWTGQSGFSSGDLDSIQAMDSSTAGYAQDTLDETSYFDVNDTMDDYASKMSFYFSPPHSGDYEFMLLADDGARLYIEGVGVVTSTMSWTSSTRMDMDENQRYLMEISHYENGGDSYIYLKAKFYDTEFTNSWTAKAEQERQTISISSTVTYDTQVLTFDQFTTQTAVHEVQEVVVNTPGEFRFGVYGVYTEPLTTDDATHSETAIQDALSALPIWGSGESILVTRLETATPTYRLTFESNRGDFPDIEVIKVAGSASVSYSVSETTQGVPDLDNIALTMEDIVSMPFSVSSISSGSLTTAVESMFESKCPSVFESASNKIYYENFEAHSSSFSGWRVSDTTPFCGRYALMNPYYIYRHGDDDLGISLAAFGTLCFAYKGFLASNIRISYSYRSTEDQETHSRTINWPYYDFKTDSDTESETWYYTCVDVYDKVYELNPDDIQHTLDGVMVYRASGSVDAYVDSVFIGRKNTTNDEEVHLRRLPGARPNNAFINRVQVSASADSFAVTLVPFDCGYDFPLFELANGGPSSELDLTTTPSYTSSSTNDMNSSTLLNESSTSSFTSSSTNDMNSSTSSSYESTSTDPTSISSSTSSESPTSSSTPLTSSTTDFTSTVSSTSSDSPSSSSTPSTSSSTDFTSTVLSTSSDSPSSSSTPSTSSSTDFTSTVSSTSSSSPSSLLTESSSKTTSSITQVTSGRTTSSSSLATLRLSNGNGNGVVEVSRTSEASPPVTGFVDVTFNGNTRTGLNVSLEAADFDKEMESLPGIGSLNVEKNGDCANFAMSVTFITLPGDLPEMTVTYGDLAGIDAAGSIATNVNGSLYYDPLTGDMVNTIHDKPQVRLYINDVPTTCSNDCSFEWDSSVTPTVTSISTSTGAEGTSVDISGTGFSSVSNENDVTIGGVSCTVTASSTTSITCDVGNGPLGLQAVEVTVDGKGTATGSVEFTYTAGISSISPSTGSLGGGVRLSIFGHGFKSDVEVSINSVTCELVSVQASEIVVVVPASANDGTFNVDVSFSDEDFTYDGYTYATGNTPTVSSVVPAAIAVTGGNIAITGAAFTSTPGSVYLGSMEADILSWTDSAIEIELLDVSLTGELDLKIDVLGDGFAVNDTNFELPTVSIELGVTNVFPLQGSMFGGTELTITGDGFGTNKSVVDVTVGNKDCIVNSVIWTKITCDISDEGETHYVTNNGVDPAFGVYYAFDEPIITINQGDFVQWDWDTPSFVYDIAHAIIEVDSPSATTAKVGGFSSGTPSSTGQYRHQFNQVGTYYVWSGFVDTWGIKNYAGTIIVQSTQSSFGLVDVKVGNAYAPHSVGGSDPSDSSSCPPITSQISGCSDSKPTGNDATKFGFAFWSCSSPVVNSINVNNGTTETDVVLSGEGFSTTPCQNEVTFGGFPCDVKSATDTELTCRMEKSGEPDLGIFHQLDMRVHNRGQAVISIESSEDKGFAIIPNIDGISSLGGSLAGGSLITISGFGFGDTPLVYVGGYTCDIVESSYSEIICETPMSSTQGDKTVEVFAYVGDAQLPAVCETQCTYVYAQLWTPSVSGISPTSMSSTTSFTISGEKFGNTASDVEVIIGGISATVSSVSDTSIVASVDNLPAGTNAVLVRIKDIGKPSGSLTVTGTPDISSISPSTGSIHGETAITISGNGFVVNDTTVTVGGNDCEIISTNLSEVVCVTAAHAEASVSVDVTSNGESYTTDSYSYAQSATPTVTSVSPTSGMAGETLTITGSNLDGGIATVFLANTICDVTSSSSTELQCTIGSHATGMVSVYVQIAGVGVSNTDIDFTYELSISSIVPSEGGTAGGQTVVIAGTGFDTDASVTICGQTCSPIDVTSSEYTCRTPANTAQTCDVEVSLNGLTETLASSYVYNAALTPSISGVNPSRGGTGGGATITISGSGFGSVSGDVSVEIDGAVCAVDTVTDSQIECLTGSHVGSIEATVEVQVAGNGIAEEASSGDANYQYIDVWSSNFTWGGGPLPQAGEFVIVPAGMTLMLDIDTPVLSFLLIQGGNLIFDEVDVELQSNIIMITDGGSLQVGTEDQPFQHKGIITLHGHHRSKELPIYGTKVLAVRNGTLDLHGIEMPITWTRLASTSAQGSTTLELVDPVDWNVGDEIVIASTGHRHTQSENEKKTITAISGDRLTLTIDSALEAEHSGEEETFDGTLVEFRAEVGLLTHNVVVRGNQDPQWEDEIKACPAGFNTGEFATQTCFLGRFGDEIGSSQFGAMILVHAPVYDTHEAQARISYTEVTFAGQAFRLGRYPIHFHLNGDMSTSYVRGCGIHHTFNRAVNIHGTHNTLIEKTVIYNIMGGAFFLEDGIETGNTIQYNLAVFVIMSSSLLNDDVTPASFWVTNPNNTIQHNAAAGGTHFGYWYRMHAHPDGPSFTSSVCPQNVPLGVFRNNSAHSFGWFGLWLFEDYFPMKDSCGRSEVEPAVFESLFAWNCDKGAEWVNAGAVQFKDFVMVQNRLAGMEGKKVINVPQYTADSPGFYDSLVVGRTTVVPSPTQGCTSSALVLPFGRGMRVKNVRFVNFDQSGCYGFGFTRITGTCSNQCGGYTYHTEKLSWINSPNRGYYAWEWEAILLDKDGTATGKPDNWTIVPSSGTLPPDCEVLSSFSFGINASTCPPQYKFHRFAFNNPAPLSLEGKDFLFTNDYGTSNVAFLKKRLTHKPGWMCALIGGETYTFEFENADHIRNISFTGQFYDFLADDYFYFKFQVSEFPDRLSIDGGNNYINATAGTIDPLNATNGDWEWDNDNNIIKLIVHGTNRQKRSMDTFAFDRPYGFTSFKCYYKNCIPPPDPDTVAPTTERPLAFAYWDDETIWQLDSEGYIANSATNGTAIPADYQNVRVLYETWVMVNMTAISKLGVLLLEGVLEFADTPGAIYEIEADFIVIRGGRLIIGWPDDPFDGLATITLRGNHSTDYFNPGIGPTLGAKAIGVFGGLDLFGRDVNTTWTELATTANVGDTQIVLSERVDWSVGDDIVIGPTGFDPWQTESFQITGVDSDQMTLTLNESCKYRHVAINEQLSNGMDISMGAAVGLLSRNIKIIGEDYPDMYEESFGARVLVGLVISKGQVYTGYARLSNVEFYHTGQEGFIDEYDPRFSVSFVAVGTVSNVKPSIVTKCSFHNGFNTAVGAFGIGGLEISDNVVFGSVGHGLRTSSDDTFFSHNLVALMISRASYQDRFESFMPNWEAGIEAIDAKNVTLWDNMVTASERMAYHVQPVACDDNTGRYRNNKLYGNVMGVVVMPVDSVDVDCAKFANFTAWKNHDFGMYFQGSQEFISENNLLVENKNGLMAIIMGPAALGHSYVHKEVLIKSTTFVGQTSSFDCVADQRQAIDDNYELSSNGRPSSPPSGGMVGLVIPTFNSGGNAAPTKPFINGKNYNAIGGLTILEDSTFAKYSSATCKSNFAISTNSGHDDGQHPVESSGTTLIDVDNSNKIIFHRPSLGKINSADCVDMDCDAKKKVLFKDADGTFLGHIGSVISESEFEWNGDSRRGLGDYRIPKEMVTELDGTRIPYNTLAPNKGIIRNENCTIVSSWNAYECNEELNYEVLVLESMDSDTETRRLSPVAILGNGYVDLINGPQDHGWCSGYTCRKRISTFQALVATGEEYLVHFTSTTPKHMRYRVLNADANEGIKLTVWYSRPNRLDVYVDEVYHIATNARIDGNGRYIITMPTGNEFEPQIANGTGTNYFDKDRGELTVIIQGSQKIDVKTSESIIVSFGLPALSVEEFFGDNIVENLAAFLNIPLTKVRIMNVVSASGNRRRRKRSSDGITVEIEIGDEPSNDLNSTVSDSIDYDTLINLASDIVNECQVGNVSDTLNMTGSCETVELPSTDPEEGTIVYETPSPDHLFFYTAPEIEYEGVPLKKQPKIRAADIGNNVVSILGTSEYPWQMTVTVRDGTGHPSNELNGTLVVNSTNGWFNFTDLALSHMGSNYVLDFNVTYPPEAENFTLSSDAFDVPGRPLKIRVFDKTSGDIQRNGPFTVTLDLLDANTEEIITDISWRQHSWTAEAQLLGNSPYASLDGVALSTAFDVGTGRALFPSLYFTGFGMYYVQFRVVSNPPDFNMTLNHKMVIKNPAHIGMTIEEEYEIKVKFDVDFNTVLPTEDKQNEFEQTILTEYANLWPDVQLSVGSIYEGSIVVSFVLSGNLTTVNDTAYGLCDSIYNNTEYTFDSTTLTLSPYMTIDNSTFYGVSCGEIPSYEEDDSDDEMEVYLIVIIVLLCVILVGAITAVVVWRLCIRPKTQTHVRISNIETYRDQNKIMGIIDMTHGTHYAGDVNVPVEDYLFREDTFSSMKFNPGLAPVATNMSGDEKRPMSGFSLKMDEPKPVFTQTNLLGVKPGYLSPPPAYYNPASLRGSASPKQGRVQQLNVNSSRATSPASSSGSRSPKNVRSHSPFDERDSPLPGSPMPPVCDNIYDGEYIRTPVDRALTPVLPAPSPTPTTRYPH